MNAFKQAVHRGSMFLAVSMALSVLSATAQDSVETEDAGFDTAAREVWLEEYGGAEKLHELAIDGTQEKWDPLGVESKTCEVTETCLPGVGGGDDPPKQPPSSPCGEASSCPPGVGLDGGVVLGDALEPIRRTIDEALKEVNARNPMFSPSNERDAPRNDDLVEPTEQER